MATSVHIVAIGARTSLGLQALPSAAALNAGISSMGDHPFMIDQVGDPMPGALDSFIDPRVMGPERFLILAESALREACTLLENTKESLQRLPVYLGLPEYRPGFNEQDAQEIQNGLRNLEQLPIQISEVKVLTEGHAAGLSALAVATEHIRKGVLEACLVGGVDSYFHPDTMEWLDENRQLVGTVSRSAFVPGEGAGFCLLMSTEVSKRLGLEVLAHVSGVAVGRESQLIKTSDTCLGEGLTATVKSAVAGLRSGETINDIICDINGERYRGEEWGFVCLRLPQYFDTPTAYRSPADCWGDTGAASGLLFVMLACQAAEGGYAKGPRTLLWASSEGGLRSTAVLELENISEIVRGGSNV